MGFAMMMAVIALFGGQIIGMGQIFSSVGRSFGLTSTSCILVAGSILIIYTMVGGLFAVAYTDMIQTMIMIVSIGFILPAMVLSEAGSQGNVIELIKPPPGGDLLGGMTVLYIVSIFIIEASFCMVDPGLWQRANASKNDRIIKNSMFVTAGVYVYWSAVCVLLGVLGTVLIPNLVEVHETSDAVIPVLAVSYLPPVLVGLVLAGLMAVMMSTASVALLISGTTVANDLVKPLKPGMSDRALLIAARATVLVVGVLGVIFALLMEGIFEIVLLAFAIYVSGVFVPVIAALYWDKATKAGAVASSAAATVVVVALYALDKPYDIEPIFVSLLVSLVTMVSVSLATYDPATATPRLFSKNTGQATDTNSADGGNNNEQ
jgi:Na+/proline symporter